MKQNSTPDSLKCSDDPIGRLHQLLQVSFLPEAIYHILEKESPDTPLLVINHQDLFLSLSNETHYIFLLPVVKPELLEKIRKELNYIPTRKKMVVQLEQEEDLSCFEHHANLTVQQIKQQAV